MDDQAPPKDLTHGSIVLLRKLVAANLLTNGVAALAMEPDGSPVFVCNVSPEEAIDLLERTLAVLKTVPPSPIDAVLAYEQPGKVTIH